MARLGVGVVGCGLNGTRHAEVYNSMDEAELIGVCDVVPEAADRVAQRHGVKAFTRIEDMLKEPGLEAVSIVTPADSHCEPAVIAAEAGKHVLGEVPFATTLEECDRMIAAAEKSGVNLMYAQVDRFMPANAAAKALIDSGEIGEVIWVTHTRMDGGSPAPEKWSRWKRSGGGFIIYEGPHYLDDFRWLTGSDIDTVYSIGMGSYVSGGDGEDNAIGGFKFKNGAFAVMMEGTSDPGARYDDYRIVGTKGMIEVIDAERSPGLRLGKDASRRFGEWKTIDIPYQEVRPIEGFERVDTDLSYEMWSAEFREFINSIQEKRQPSCTGYDGRASVEAALALRMSEETGSPVHLPLEIA